MVTGRRAAYVHIPFCGAICPYCDFAVVAGRDDLAERYADAVIAEIDRTEDWSVLDAVYFGGGTPSRVPDHLVRILSSIEHRFGLRKRAEVSLEANPEDFDRDTAAMLTAGGFNRVSFGAQSFDESVLLSLGRRHVSDQIERAVENARAGGFHNLSLDLIYGTPGESDRSWADSLTRAIATGPDHVSCYALTVESGTPLGRQVRDGAPAPDPDVQASRFEAADNLLTTAGLERYEVSNWSKPGRQCVYNAAVWDQGEYLAFGNGAHGFRDGVRTRNARRLDTYLEKVEGGESAIVGSDRLEGWDLEIDRLFVGLRRTIGATSGPAGAALLASGHGERLVEAGIVVVDGDSIRVANPMLTDEVLRAVLALDAPSDGENPTIRDIVLPNRMK